MCEECRRKDKKDPSDYIFANENGIIFVKTHEGVYLKAKEIRTLRAVTSSMTDHHYVEVSLAAGCYVIEKFDSKEAAKAFLKEFIEDEFYE